MTIVCWQTILMKNHTLVFFRKLRKMSQNLSSATVVIGALMVKAGFTVLWQKSGKPDGREIKKILAMKILH